MAKGSPLMGTQSGKRGQAVLYRRNGQQVERAWIPRIANPKSEKQRVQRMVINTAAAAYSALQPICNHSWECVQPRLKSMSHFMRMNSSMLRSVIRTDRDGEILDAQANYNVRGWSGLEINPYIISRGTLNPIAHVDFRNDNDLGQWRGYNVIPFHLFAYDASDRDVVVDWFKTNHVQDADWVTVCFIVRHEGSDVDGHYDFRFCWIRFTTWDTEGDMPYSRRAQVTDNNIGIPNGLDIETLVSSDGSQSGDAYWGFDLEDYMQYEDWSVMCYGMIHSRVTDRGRWLRSNANLHMRTQLRDLDTSWPNDVHDVLDTYGDEVQAVGQSEYILQGGSV